MFQKELDKLNSAQRDAVDTIDGPVMVIAGPGTGKTQVLTLRIANILEKTDTEPESILAVTFTESGVASMRKRLAQMIGSTAYQIYITTFHAFANSIIQDYPEEFPHIIGSRSITEVEQVQILQDILREARLNQLKPFGDVFYYLKPVLSAINNLKREGVGVREFKKLIEEEEEEFDSIADLYHEKGAHKGKMKGVYKVQLKQIEKNKELAELYEKYQNELKDQKLYDYSDMIMEVVRELESNEDLLFSIQEKYQYLLIDEHQDTNNAQNKIIELVASFHPNPNVFVVGDEKQAIFRFQGASLENFLYFQKLYPKAKLIKLTDNYRSSQTILNAAHSILQSVLDPKAELKSKKLIPEKEIELAQLSSPAAESYFIASHIKEQIKKGVSPKDIAVLYRDNRDSLEIANALEKLEVPFIIESDQNIFEDSDIQRFISLLQAINSLGSTELLARALHAEFLNIDPFDIYKIISHTKRYNEKTGERKSLFDAIQTREILEEIDCTSKDQIYSTYQKLAKWKKQAEFQNLTEVFESVSKESGFLEYLLQKENSVEKLEKLTALFDEAKTLVANNHKYKLRQFIDYLALLDQHDILVKKPISTRDLNKVRLMTAHKSKGQEFDFVHIAGVYDGHWGGRRRSEKLPLPSRVLSLFNVNTQQFKHSQPSALDEERNLFYVAITRARREIVVSYANANADGKEQIPSRFIGEINQKYLKELTTEKYESEFSQQIDKLLSPAKTNGPSVSDKAFLREVFLIRGLSATSLNNYLKCPWEYFFKNLVRIPQSKNKHMMYGTAVHAVLDETMKKVNAEEKPSEEFLLKTFESALKKEPLQENDFQEALEKGMQALKGYFKQYSGMWKKCLTEYKVSGIALKLDKDEILLNGKLDKVELGGGGEFLSVVDYKTGKPKTRNDIMGKTKTSTGDYYRQLVFYALLLSSTQSPKLKAESSFVLDFIEPDEKKRYHLEEFKIAPEEVADLEKEVLRVAQEILNLDFWDKNCDKKDCQYCQLAKTIQVAKTS